MVVRPHTHTLLVICSLRLAAGPYRTPTTERPETIQYGHKSFYHKRETVISNTRQHWPFWKVKVCVFPFSRSITSCIRDVGLSQLVQKSSNDVQKSEALCVLELNASKTHTERTNTRHKQNFFFLIVGKSTTFNKHMRKYVLFRGRVE